MKKFTYLWLFFYLSPLSATDYANFQYPDFFGLPRKLPLGEPNAQQKIDSLIKQYAPEQAKNFIAFEEYKKYRYRLQSIFTKLQSKKPLTTPTKKEISTKIAFDFFLLMQKQVPRDALELSKFQTLQRNIYDYIKRKGTSITISNVLTTLEGLIKIAEKQDFSATMINLLKIKNNELIKIFQEEAENKEHCLEVAIRQDFNYTYLDETMRNNSIKAYLDLIQSIYPAQKIKINRILTNLNDLIKTQWGALFPIEKTLQEKLNNFLAHQERMKNLENSLNEILITSGKNLHIWAHKKAQEVLGIIKKYKVEELFQEELNEIKQKIENHMNKIKEAIEKKDQASQEELKEFTTLKQQVQKASIIFEKEKKALEAIEIIDPYKKNAPLVIELYNSLIEDYIVKKNLKKIDEYLKKAETKIKTVKPQEFATVPGFQKAKNEFDQLKLQAENLKQKPPVPQRKSILLQELIGSLQELRSKLTTLLQALNTAS